MIKMGRFPYGYSLVVYCGRVSPPHPVDGSGVSIMNFSMRIAFLKDLGSDVNKGIRRNSVPRKKATIEVDYLPLWPRSKGPVPKLGSKTLILTLRSKAVMNITVDSVQNLGALQCSSAGFDGVAY